MLDSFQFIIGIYLMVVAILGKGHLYQFNIQKENGVFVRGRLRQYYFLLSGISFLNGSLSILQNSLFRRFLDQAGQEQIVKNPNISFPDWLSYSHLTIVSVFLTIVFLLVIGLTLLLLRKFSEH